MNAKDKAKELICKFNNSYNKESKSYILYQNVEESKRCALITVDELIKYTQYCSEFGGQINCETIEYWKIVKNEIEKIL